jgi:hypothetical protein
LQHAKLYSYCALDPRDVVASADHQFISVKEPRLGHKWEVIMEGASQLELTSNENSNKTSMKTPAF